MPYEQVTDELFDEIATKVINEDEAIPKGLCGPEILFYAINLWNNY